MLRRADLVIAMARLHVREAAVLLPEALRKTFTLKELARGAADGRGARRRRAASTRGSAASPMHGSRRRSLGVRPRRRVDVADPVGRGRADYEVTADLLDRLLGDVVDLAFPVRTRAEGQRA